MKNKKIFKIIYVSLILLIIISIIFFWQYYNPKNNLEVTFLDIGQGDATLIKTPFNQNILIDVGADFKIIQELSKNIAWWDKTIDLIIISHPHDDHIGGIIDVLRRYNIGQIIYTGVLYDAPVYLEFLELAQAKNIDLIIANKPQTITLGDNCKIDILYPFESYQNKQVNNLNNSSVVSKLDCANKKFLFSGDAELETEEELVNYLTPNPSPSKGEGRTPIDLQADVFKASHHGSDTSNSQEFLEQILPKIVVISVGQDNNFGHPSRRSLKRFERIGASIYRTDLDGAVKFIVRDGEIIL